MKNRLHLFDTLHLPETAATPGSIRWQDALASGIRSLDELLLQVGLTRKDVALPLESQLDRFPLRVPLSYVNKIEKGNPKDPLLLQVLPSAQEFVAQPGFVQDPLKEIQANPVPGLIHKYKSRVLLVTTQACLIHCRYCFRRHFPYDDNSTSSSNLARAVDYIAQHAELEEVILSGGDPMSMSDTKLVELLRLIAQVPHVKRIRIHSRLISVMPSRVTAALLHDITSFNKPLVMVLHINHPHEIDDELIEACHLMKAAGIHLLNQSVLLRGVNDDVSTLKQLNLRVFDAGILPYYLHLLDPVEGASHFDVSLSEAQTLMAQLQAEISGYLVPKLVTERPGLKSKFLVGFDTL